MQRLFAISLVLSGCAFSDPRNPTLRKETLNQIQNKAQETASWSPWCEKYPSNAECDDADSMAGSLGFLCAVGFEPSCKGVALSVKDNGQLQRSPYRHDTDNTASRDQLLGFLAAQLSGENKWLDVKRFIKSHGKICLDATDTRCDLTPTVWALIGGIHAHLGYDRDASMIVNGLFWDRLLLAQTITVPLGYQLNLNVEAAWIAYKAGIETERSYQAALMAYALQPLNPWFCVVAFGPHEQCAQLALAQWPVENEYKSDWGIQRSMTDESWKRSSGWGWLFIAGLFGVDLNTLEYSGKRYSKDSLRPH